LLLGKFRRGGELFCFEGLFIHSLGNILIPAQVSNFQL
jgi:hypothetical protein